MHAIRDLTDVIRLNGANAAVHNNRGICLAKTGDYQGAFNDYTAALRLNPAYANALYNRGVVLTEMERYDEAIADLRQASEAQATPAIWNQIAWAYYRKGFTCRGVAVREPRPRLG